MKLGPRQLTQNENSVSTFLSGKGSANPARRRIGHCHCLICLTSQADKRTDRRMLPNVLSPLLRGR